MAVRFHLLPVLLPMGPKTEWRKKSFSFLAYHKFFASMDFYKIFVEYPF